VFGFQSHVVGGVSRRSLVLRLGSSPGVANFYPDAVNQFSVSPLVFPPLVFMNRFVLLLHCHLVDYFFFDHLKFLRLPFLW
jgi:hypothetical protein